MLIILVVCSLFASCKFCYGYQSFNFKFQSHPYMDLTLSELIKKYHYPVEIHRLVTEDGYILHTHRIPYGIVGPQKRTNRSAVVILHGMGGVPQHFTVLGPKKALAYYLADNGFDVWLLNARGGTYSRGHKRYDWNADQRFWLFSWDEIGYYDIAAQIDYVLKNTDQGKVFFIGHSSASTSYLAFSSQRPQYAKKIKMAAIMAASCFMGSVEIPALQPIQALAPLARLITESLGVHEVPLPGAGKGFNILVKNLCSEVIVLREICFGLMSIIGTHKSRIFDKSLMTLVLGELPARLSLMQMYHYAQLIETGEFTKYDLGPRRNLVKYGSIKPPAFNLSNSKAPLALFYAESDHLATAYDAMRLGSSLPNLVYLHKVQYNHFNHLDFLFGGNTTDLVYKHIHNLFKDYDNGKIPSRIRLNPNK